MTEPKDVKLVTQIKRAFVSEVRFMPTIEQRDLKAKFWVEFRSNPLCDIDNITPALVNQLTGEDIQPWLADERFWKWFSHRDSVKPNLEMAAELASELACYYLDPSVPFNDNARVALIRHVLEFSGRSPGIRQVEKWMDKEIAQLSEEQLDAFIHKLTSKRT